MSNTFGKIFQVTTFGESHGPGIGCVVDGCPPRIPLPLSVINTALARRRPGGPLSSPRKEADKASFLSGVFDGKTLGTPIAMWVKNEDQRSHDYDNLHDVYRPSHADYTTIARYGIRDHRGGGRASARETISRVMAGALAEHALGLKFGCSIVAWVSHLGPYRWEGCVEDIGREDVDKSLVRCPDLSLSHKMVSHLEGLRDDGDSIGGEVTCCVKGVPAGLGAPVFDKLHAEFARAILSIPACRGIEIGTGFAAKAMKGSEHNDGWVSGHDHQPQMQTNHCGGIQGGISVGPEAPLIFRAAFKPPSSIRKQQDALTQDGKTRRISIEGRHDPFIAARAVPVVESMVSLVLMDQWLRYCALSHDFIEV